MCLVVEVARVDPDLHSLRLSGTKKLLVEVEMGDHLRDQEAIDYIHLLSSSFKGDVDPGRDAGRCQRDVVQLGAAHWIFQEVHYLGFAGRTACNLDDAPVRAEA